MKKKIKSLCWGVINQRKITVGKNNVTNIIKKGEYPQPIEYRVYEKDRKSPRVIDGLRIDKIEFFE